MLPIRHQFGPSAADAEDGTIKPVLRGHTVPRRVTTGRHFVTLLMLTADRREMHVPQTDRCLH